MEAPYFPETLAKQLTCTRNSYQNARIHISGDMHKTRRSYANAPVFVLHRVNILVASLLAGHFSDLI
jgi:hypothetical protein